VVGQILFCCPFFFLVTLSLSFFVTLILTSLFALVTLSPLILPDFYSFIGVYYSKKPSPPIASHPQNSMERPGSQGC